MRRPLLWDALDDDGLPAKPDPDPGSTITNYTGYDTRRVDIDVGAEYSADIDATRAALEEAAASVQRKLDDPAPQVLLKKLGSSSVDWQVRVWCKTEDFWGGVASHDASLQAVARHGGHRNSLSATRCAPRRNGHQGAVALVGALPEMSESPSSAGGPVAHEHNFAGHASLREQLVRLPRFGKKKSSCDDRFDLLPFEELEQSDQILAK